MRKRGNTEPMVGRTAGASILQWTCGNAAARAAVQPSAADAILCENYRQLTRSHLERLPGLFRELTGLECYVAWVPPWPGRWKARDLPAHSALCRQLVARNAGMQARCRRCAAQHLARTFKSGHNGHRFTCFLGVHNFWLRILVRNCIVGLAFVQALGRPAEPSARPGPNHGRRQVSRPEFKHAAKLLQLIFQQVETSALADLRKSDSTRAQQALFELQTVVKKLREQLNGLIPAFNKTAPALQPENHTQQLVHAALEYLHRHYAQPLTLRQYARGLGMNAAYLSAVFSRAVGMPFKTYLTEVRLEKARELLSDPAKRISEVARAVGYASENRFRSAFKKLTGLSPRSWRETFRTATLIILGWLLEEQEFIESVEAVFV